mmetsp:Transcript_24919/g.46847  ORF Transcript_24919/g.46847 Transcript_24919/m.46847 type:complete len:241 (-) Transcript_24919:2959-3681(-)
MWPMLTRAVSSRHIPPLLHRVISARPAPAYFRASLKFLTLKAIFALKIMQLVAFLMHASVASLGSGSSSSASSSFSASSSTTSPSSPFFSSTLASLSFFSFLTYTVLVAILSMSFACKASTTAPALLRRDENTPISSTAPSFTMGSFSFSMRATMSFTRTICKRSATSSPYRDASSEERSKAAIHLMASAFFSSQTDASLRKGASPKKLRPGLASPSSAPSSTVSAASSSGAASLLGTPQ